MTEAKSNKKPRKERKPSVDSLSFIRAWQESKTLKEVAQRLDMRTASASQRATNMRRLGIPLQQMPRHELTVELDSLIELAKNMAAEQKAQEKAKEKSELKESSQKD